MLLTLYTQKFGSYCLSGNSQLSILSLFQCVQLAESTVCIANAYLNSNNMHKYNLLMSLQLINIILCYSLCLLSEFRTFKGLSTWKIITWSLSKSLTF